MFKHEIVDITEEDLPFKIIRHINVTAFIHRHWHRSFELNYVLKGQIKEFIINGHHFNPQAETLLIVNPNEIHSVYGITNSGEENVSLSILIPYAFMEKTVPEFVYRYYQIPYVEEMSLKQIEDYTKIKQQLTTLFTISESNESIESIRIMGLIYEILYLLTTSFSVLKETTNDLYKDTSEFDWIDQVLVYIQTHVTDTLSVKEIATTFHLNESYFSRKFKKYMDMTVKDYITEVRLQEAYQLLTNTNVTIQAIADQCGFPNHKSFITSFKKKYYTTPKSYRKKVEKSQKLPK